MEFRQFDVGSRDYEQALVLRERILRTPLGLRLAADDLRDEDQQFHFGLFEGGALVACVVIKPLAGKGHAKLRQMAVVEARQGSGLGRTLVRGVERALRERGFHVLELSARGTATGFYEGLGYVMDGDLYLEQGIPHIRMWKRL